MRAKSVIVAAAGAILGIGAFSLTGHAFNPQPDPPGFGLVTLVADQGIRVNVVCSAHGAGRFPPDPCFGTLMIHGLQGQTLASLQVALRPGEAASLPFEPIREAAAPVGIDPCWVPADGNRGHAIPSAEVFSMETGRTMLFLNPAVARLSNLAIDPAVSRTLTEQ